jgi:DNA-binding NarL/FixJ family response regulator
MKKALVRASSRGEPWEVVVSDYYMLRFGAPVALEVLRGLGYDTPSDVVSGKLGEDVVVAMLRAGAQDYVTKEDMARLCPAIRKGAGGRERARQRDARALRGSRLPPARGVNRRAGTSQVSKSGSCEPKITQMCDGEEDAPGP